MLWVDTRLLRGKTYEGSAVGVERLARDIERLILLDETSVSTAGGTARRVGVAPETLALIAGRRRQADAGVVDLCMDKKSQLTWLVEALAHCDLPLSLYSVLCLSPKSIDFGGALGVFSTTPEVGRAFSSCLRNGLRMIGIVSNVLWRCFQGYPGKMLFV